VCRWILGNANWLQSHSGTSFSDTSAGWGLGPSGRMERLDIVNGEDNVRSAFRRDWELDVCRQVGAADPKQAKKCPNERPGYNH
jgi:ribosomal protein L40E